MNEYLEAVGGREAIFGKHEEEKARMSTQKGKKRARSSTGVDTSTPTNGSKRGRKPKLEHSQESTPPTGVSDNFAPPTGNWEEEVQDIDACEGQGGVPIVFITWKSGHKSQHPLKQVYKRCPQKVCYNQPVFAFTLTYLLS